jgi:hypothetical protein
MGGVGVLLLAAVVFGDYSDVVGPVLVLAGAILVTLAAFWSRIKGTVELTKDGAKIPISPVERAERQVEQNRTVDAVTINSRLDALEYVLRAKDWPPELGGSIAKSPPAHEGRSVQLVDDAVVAIVLLTPQERALVESEIERLRKPEFRWQEDPLATGAEDQGRSYRIREIPGTDLRMLYRPLSEADPETLVVIVIERKGLGLIKGGPKQAVDDSEQ